MIVLDAGAPVPLDRNDREVWARSPQRGGRWGKVLVPLAALAQAWRGGSRQARLAQALRHVQRVSFDEVTIAAGGLCDRAGTEDMVDASIALVAARPGITHVYTSDEDDIGHLLSVVRTKSRMIRC